MSHYRQARFSAYQTQHLHTLPIELSTNSIYTAQNTPVAPFDHSLASPLSTTAAKSSIIQNFHSATQNHTFLPIPEHLLYYFYKEPQANQIGILESSTTETDNLAHGTNINFQNNTHVRQHTHAQSHHHTTITSLDQQNAFFSFSTPNQQVLNSDTLLSSVQQHQQLLDSMDIHDMGDTMTDETLVLHNQQNISRIDSKLLDIAPYDSMHDLNSLNNTQATQNYVSPNNYCIDEDNECLSVTDDQVQLSYNAFIYLLRYIYLLTPYSFVNFNYYPLLFLNPLLSTQSSQALGQVDKIPSSQTSTPLQKHISICKSPIAPDQNQLKRVTSYPIKSSHIAQTNPRNLFDLSSQARGLSQHDNATPSDLSVLLQAMGPPPRPTISFPMISTIFNLNDTDDNSDTITHLHYPGFNFLQIQAFLMQSAFSYNVRVNSALFSNFVRNNLYNFNLYQQNVIRTQHFTAQNDNINILYQQQCTRLHSIYFVLCNQYRDGFTPVTYLIMLGCIHSMLNHFVLIYNTKYSYLNARDSKTSSPSNFAYVPANSLPPLLTQPLWFIDIPNVVNTESNAFLQHPSPFSQSSTSEYSQYYNTMAADLLDGQMGDEYSSILENLSTSKKSEKLADSSLSTNTPEYELSMKHMQNILVFIHRHIISVDPYATSLTTPVRTNAFHMIYHILRYLYTLIYQFKSHNTSKFNQNANNCIDEFPDILTFLSTWSIITTAPSAGNIINTTGNEKPISTLSDVINILTNIYKSLYHKQGPTTVTSHIELEIGRDDIDDDTLLFNLPIQTSPAIMIHGLDILIDNQLRSQHAQFDEIQKHQENDGDDNQPKTNQYELIVTTDADIANLRHILHKLQQKGVNIYIAAAIMRERRDTDHIIPTGSKIDGKLDNIDNMKTNDETPLTPLKQVIAAPPSLRPDTTMSKQPSPPQQQFPLVYRRLLSLDYLGNPTHPSASGSKIMRKNHALLRPITTTITVSTPQTSNLHHSNIDQYNNLQSLCLFNNAAVNLQYQTQTPCFQPEIKFF